MSSIVLFDDKKDCCGCGACMNVCPKNAIRMAEDEVGFVYPEIDQNLCIGCGACKKACGYQMQPMIERLEHFDDKPALYHCELEIVDEN